MTNIKKLSQEVEDSLFLTSNIKECILWVIGYIDKNYLSNKIYNQKRDEQYSFHLERLFKISCFVQSSYEIREFLLVNFLQTMSENLKNNLVSDIPMFCNDFNIIYIITKKNYNHNIIITKIIDEIKYKLLHIINNQGILLENNSQIDREYVLITKFILYQNLDYDIYNQIKNDFCDTKFLYLFQGNLVDFINEIEAEIVEIQNSKNEIYDDIKITSTKDYYKLYLIFDYHHWELYLKSLIKIIPPTGLSLQKK